MPVASPLLRPQSNALGFSSAYLLRGICFRARRTGDGQNGDRRRGVSMPSFVPRVAEFECVSAPLSRHAAHLVVPNVEIE